MSRDYQPYPITINGGDLGEREACDAYESRVKVTLDYIARSDSGGVLLKAITNTSRTLTVKPYVSNPKTSPSLNNASAKPRDWVGATARGKDLLRGGSEGDRFKPVTHGFFQDRYFTGTGEGSDVDVLFTPATWGYGGAAAVSRTDPITPGSPASSPSAVLLHELAHAYRMMAGRFSPSPMVEGRRQYDTEEEFFAIVISNIYVTDPTAIIKDRVLRADHWGFNTLAPSLATSKGFLADDGNRRALARLLANEGALVSDLLHVKSTFNPVKEYARPSAP